MGKLYLFTQFPENEKNYAIIIIIIILIFSPPAQSRRQKN